MSDEERMVYVVTSGDYDAYCIQAVYSTRAGAEAFVSHREANATPVDKFYPLSVEEWPLDPPQEDA